MKIMYFVGIDISKASFDVALCKQDNPGIFTHLKFDNTSTGYKQLLAWLKKQQVN